VPFGSRTARACAGAAPDLVRIVEGLRGSVEIELELTLRFDYGRSVPWVQRDARGIVATPARTRSGCAVSAC
jgi:hypothetical protein